MYEAFYGFTADPFRLSPDPRFYYESPSHQKAMAYLTYGLDRAEGFIVITGETGTGKTTLSQRLLEDLQESQHITVTLTNTQMDPLEALQSIGQGFGLSEEGNSKPQAIRQIREFLEGRDAATERPLLIVDEAQNLPPKTLEELRMLANLQQGGRSLLQFIFLAQPQFIQTLERPEFSQFRERIGAAVDLDRLRKSDIKGYIEHRLSVVGWSGDPQITAEAYDLIFDVTSGLPRRVNKFFARCLLSAFLDERHEVDEALVEKVSAELRDDPSWSDEVPGLRPSRPNAAGTSEPTDAGTDLDKRVEALEIEVKSIEKMLRQLLDLLVKRQSGA